MPNDMSKENPSSSADFLRSLGGVTKFPANEISAQAAKNLPNPEWKSNMPDIRMQLIDPNDPNFEAMMRGRFGTEREAYERDPFGLYNASVNYAETLLKFSRLPDKGSPDYESHVKQAIFNLQLSIGGKMDLDDSKLESIVTRDLQEKEISLSEELDRNYRLAIASGNRSISETLMMLESFTPPKPFEANMQERNLQGARQTLEAVTSYFDSKIPEKIIGRFRKYDALSEQQIGLFNILCAAGGGMEGYYDAIAQAGGTLLSRSRFHASMADFRAAYTDDNPGVTTHKLTPEQSVYIKDTLASKEIRETQVELLSQARRLILFNSDVAQYDVDKPNDEEGVMRLNPDRIQGKIDNLNSRIRDLRAGDADNEEIGRLQKHADSLERTKNLNLENHREFMRLVFGEIDKSKWIKWKSPDTGKEIETPQSILTWYASDDKLKSREEWESRMVAVMLWKSNDGKDISDFLEDQNLTPDQILQVARDVLKKASLIRSNIGDKVMQSDLEFSAAKIALVSWLEKDKAFQKSGRLAWKFDYVNKFKKDGQDYTLPNYVRVYDSGGIYKAYDSINLKYYWRRWTSYKAGLKSATTFFGPASDGWRGDVSRHSPDWLPSLRETRTQAELAAAKEKAGGIDGNPKIKSIHDRFFDVDPANPDPAKRLWRARRLTGNDSLTIQQLDQMIATNKLKEPTIDKNMQKWLLETGWTFESAYGVPIPMFLPKTFPISLDEQMQDKSSKETVDDLYAMGILPKDIDWSVYNYESLDRMWVSMSMLTKFAHLFVDSYDEQRDTDFQKFFASPGVQSIAEMAKRVYLAYRDRPEGYQPYILSVVPFMIAQQMAKETHLLSPDLDVLNGIEKETIIKQWNFKMADWIRGAMWTPEVLLDDQQLYDGANADIQSMRNDIALMIMYYKHIFEKVAQAGAKSDKGKLETFYKDQIRIYKGSLVGEMTPGEGETAFDWSVGGNASIVDTFARGEKAVEKLLFGDKR